MEVKRSKRKRESKEFNPIKKRKIEEIKNLQKKIKELKEEIEEIEINEQRKRIKNRISLLKQGKIKGLIFDYEPRFSGFKSIKFSITETFHGDYANHYGGGIINNINELREDSCDFYQSKINNPEVEKLIPTPRYWSDLLAFDLKLDPVKFIKDKVELGEFEEARYDPCYYTATVKIEFKNLFYVYK